MQMNYVSITQIMKYICNMDLTKFIEEFQRIIGLDMVQQIFQKMNIRATAPLSCKTLPPPLKNQAEILHSGFRVPMGTPNPATCPSTQPKPRVETRNAV